MTGSPGTCNAAKVSNLLAMRRRLSLPTSPRNAPGCCHETATRPSQGGLRSIATAVPGNSSGQVERKLVKRILIALPLVALVAACGKTGGTGGGGSSSDIHIVGSSTV